MNNEMLASLPAINPTLAKRIKRRITARPQSFFAITPPGIETLCLEEINALSIPGANPFVTTGGVAFTGHLHDAYLLNLHSRVAGRILMRIADFRSTSFGSLEKRLSEISWELYLYPGMRPKISVTAHKSRLYHKGAVAERVLDSIKQTIGEEDSAMKVAPKIFVRIVSDRVTLSIDSSGELLYKRGIKPLGGKAPLRETLGAAILMLAGFTPGDVLLDPMCGSGTFSMEAAMIGQQVPAGLYREFAFMAWPSFRPQRWAYLKKAAVENLRLSDLPFVFSSDRDKAVCRLLQKRFEPYDFTHSVEVSCIDFLKITPDMITHIGKHAKSGGKKIVVLNPPYGRRLGAQSDARKLYRVIKEKLASDFNGWHFAMIVPAPFIKERIPHMHQQFPLSHGGIRLTLVIGMIP